MTRPVYLKALLLVLVLFLSGEAFYGDPSRQSPDGKATTETGQLAVVEGMVELKPKGSPQYSRVSTGIPFRRGDLLKVAASAKATVVCSDLTKHELKNGVYGLPCKPSSGKSQVLMFDGAWVKVSPTRSNPSDLDIPIIISPRKTKLLDPTPTLRWTAVPGVSIYRITVQGQKLNWSAEVISKTEIIYSSEKEKQLTPGETYKLIVKAGDHISDEEGLPGLGFTLLMPEQAQHVRNLEQRIRALGLPEASTKLLVAQLYAKSKLNAEAIEQLRVAPAATNEPAAAQLLGDLYFAIGLNRLAEEQHLLALKLAEQMKDLLSQARAQYSLGHVYEMIGNRGAAVKYLRRALEIYQQFMDVGLIKEIEEALARLQNS